ncbi:MAG: putative beta-barrel porin 2 [Verrucomicrobiota bacterium]
MNLTSGKPPCLRGRARWLAVWILACAGLNGSSESAAAESGRSESNPARSATSPAAASEARETPEEKPAETAVPAPSVPQVKPVESARGRVGVEAPDPVFSVPPIYGYAPAVFGRGVGRTGRNRWTLTSAFSTGYDDNVFITPTHGEAVPAVFREVAELVPGKGFEVRRVLVSPAVPAPERQGSLVGQSGVGGNFQILGRRTLFALDAGINWTHYWDRPGTDPDDYNGRLAWSFAYRLTPRLQISAQFNGAYLSQPDFTRINTPLGQAGGEYFSGNAKADISYRWTPRLSSVLSLSENALRNQEPAAQAGDYDEWIVGGQVRYLITPMWSVLMEGRYGFIFYDAAPDRDSSTQYLLVGGDFQLSPRLFGTVRLGGAIREFDESGVSSTAPYGEGTLVYRLAPGSKVELRSRYGFEEPQAANQKLLSWRSSASYLQILSSRASLNLGMNYLRQVQTTSPTSPTSPTGLTGTVEQITQSVEGSLRLQYYLTRRFSVNANYVHTLFDAMGKTQDYYRNRLFLGGEYEF